MNFSQLVSMARRCAGVASILALTACGGHADNDDTQPLARSQSADPVVAPLLHDDGAAPTREPGARPLDAGAWTQSGRYATDAEARLMADALGDDVLQIDVECCSAQAVDVAVGMAWALQAAHDLSDHVPVLVRGADLRMAAAAVNRLAAGGLTQVWLVTP